MKSIGCKTMACAALIALVFLVPACSKKQISSEPYGAESAAEAQRRAEEAARLEQQKRIGEEDIDAARRREEQARQVGTTVRESFENEDIHFLYDSAALTTEAQQILRRKAQWLMDNPGVRVVIEGHCDERGTNEYNLALGEARAQSAKNYLVDLGVSAARISIISFGEERPLDPRATEEAWAKNRRAHFVIQP